MFCVLTQENYKATKDSCLEGRLRKARDKVFLECAHVPEFMNVDSAGGAPGLCKVGDFRDAPVNLSALGDENWIKELDTIDSEKAMNMHAIATGNTLSYSGSMGGGILKLWQNGFLGNPTLPGAGPTTSCNGLYGPKRQDDTGDKYLTVTVNLGVCASVTSTELS